MPKSDARDGEYEMASWFRSWHGAPTDSKWLVIAKRAKVIPGIVSAIAWELFDYASQNDDRGSVVGFDIETYSTFSGFDEEVVSAVIKALHDKGVITDNNRIASWEKRQPKAEDDSAARVKAYRERKKDAEKPAEKPVDEPATPLLDIPTDDSDAAAGCNDDVTSPHDDVTECNDASRSVTPCNSTEQNRAEQNRDRTELCAGAHETPSPPVSAAKQEPIKAQKAKRTDKPAAASEKVERPRDLLFDAIAEVCQIDPSIHVNGAQIGRAKRELSQADPPYNETHVRNFGKWWLSDDWRKRNTPIPSMPQLLQKIAQGAHYTNGDARAAPVQSADTPGQIKLRELRAKQKDRVWEA